MTVFRGETMYESTRISIARPNMPTLLCNSLWQTFWWKFCDLSLLVSGIETCIFWAIPIKCTGSYYVLLKNVILKQVFNKVFWKGNSLKKKESWATLQAGNELNMSLIILNLQVIEWGRVSNYFWVKLRAWRKRNLSLKLGKMDKSAVSLH